MVSYISILRGINVSGHRVIKMDALKKMCSDLGLKNVNTYIQSGNIVFESKEENAQKISIVLKANIEKLFGNDVPVLTISAKEFKEIMANNPFAKNTDETLIHVTFLSEQPTKEGLKNLQNLDTKNDEYKLGNKVIYLYCPNGYGNTKLNNTLLENKLKVTATTRNWKTCNQLLKMCNFY
jgi:uncharacterized protein (DUF1697 family)